MSVKAARPSLTVRRAKESDIPALSALLLQVDMVHHNGRPDLFKGPAVKYDEAVLRALLSDDTRPVFVCCDEAGTVLGHAFCVHKQILGDPVLTDIKTLYIDDICVDEKARGRHAGTALFEAVRAYAKESGCYNLTLNVWSCNPGALGFYKAMGLTPQKVGMEMLL